MSSDELQTVTVVIGSSPTVPGGTVDAVVTITGKPDHKVRGAKAQLVRTGLQRVIQTNVIGHGQHNTLIRDEVVVAEAPLTSHNGKVLPGEHAVSLPLPDDALPSATDMVWWSVKAIIDRRLGIDVKAQAPVEVLSGPERFASEATDEARHVGEPFVDLELSTRTLRPAETITGTVRLRPTRPMTIDNVLVMFVLSASVKDGLDNTPVAPQTLFNESLDLQPGDTRKFPFELTLPGDAAPTVRGSLTTPPCRSCVSWQVGASARSLRSPADKTSIKGYVYLGVNVYNADVPRPISPGPG